MKLHARILLKRVLKNRCVRVNRPPTCCSTHRTLTLCPKVQATLLKQGNITNFNKLSKRKKSVM